MVEQEYLSVEHALKIVLSEVTVLPAERVPLLEGLGRVLAEEIVARYDLPIFPNSSMDGYAVRSVDVLQAGIEKPVSLQVIGDISAGSEDTITLIEGTAVRITTGAPIPGGADAVVPVEDTNEPWRGHERPLPERIEINRSVQRGAYVRFPGEDVQSGTSILSPGCALRPQEIGILAAMGFVEVPVVRKPRVGILATGDELVDVETPLSSGKIRNSNSYTQAAQVTTLKAKPIILGIAKDTVDAVSQKLKLGIEQDVDLFVTSAGVSVGAYDVVKALLEQEGDIKFWRVRMRPGKPLTFGSYEGVPFFGLPGNPVSAMVSFERFARPAILKMGGHALLERPIVPVTIEDEIDSDGRESYVRAIVERKEDGYRATITGRQGSHMLSSLVEANALVIVPEGVKHVSAGTSLKAMMIDWPQTVF